MNSKLTFLAFSLLTVACNAEQISQQRELTKLQVGETETSGEEVVTFTYQGVVVDGKTEIEINDETELMLNKIEQSADSVSLAAATLAENAPLVVEGGDEDVAESNDSVTLQFFSDTGALRLAAKINDEGAYESESNASDFKGQLKVISSKDKVTCSSSGESYAECVMPGLIVELKVKKTISKIACELGKSYGFDKNLVWVDKGCRADFELVYLPTAWSAVDPDFNVKNATRECNDIYLKEVTLLKTTDRCQGIYDRFNLQTARLVKNCIGSAKKNFRLDHLELLGAVNRIKYRIEALNKLISSTAATDAALPNLKKQLLAKQELLEKTRKAAEVRLNEHLAYLAEHMADDEQRLLVSQTNLVKYTCVAK